jgi:glycosyltransferase involved in cell wall biosynthesis
MPTQSGRDGCVGVTAQITTIIPTFMRPQLLGRAIRSVLGQSYPHFEVHVYDNASGDETPQSLRSLPSMIRGSSIIAILRISV